VIRRRRHVLYIAGYDPVSPEQLYQRFERQIQIFRRTWDLQANVSPLRQTGLYPIWNVITRGPNWETETTFELLAWDDLVNSDSGGSRVVRLVRALETYLNLLITGTLFRYMTANLRYFVFTIVPLLQLIMLGCVACVAAFYLSLLMPLPSIINSLLIPFGGVAALLLLLEWPGRRWRIYQAFDDWILSLDYVYGVRSDLMLRLDQFAERIASSPRENKFDEIIVVGHSLGATFAIDAAARALKLSPKLGTLGTAVSVVTLGATIPKCVLHPAAKRIRKQVARIVDASGIYWLEYQIRADAISFYRFNPATMRRLRDRKESIEGKPVIRSIQAHNMLRSETFRKYRFRVLRLHYQCVSANDRRAAYDYYMMICGPLLVASWSKSAQGVLDFFGNGEGANSVIASADQKL
jgi:Lipase (class 3)